MGRREPAHGMQISCVGRGAAWLICSLCVCLSVTGHPLKIRDFWEIASSFLSLRQVERSKLANKHVSEKILCSSVSKMPSTRSAERFGSLHGVLEHFGTSCHFWVQNPPGPRPPGPTKQGPCLAQPRQMRRLEMMKYHFPRPCGHVLSIGLLRAPKSGSGMRVFCHTA